MGHLEKKMEGRDWFPRLWMRYADDVLAIVKKGMTERVLEELNKQRPGVIRFTVEEEKDGQLPFLDLLPIREVPLTHSGSQQMHFCVSQTTQKIRVDIVDTHREKPHKCRIESCDK